MRSEHRASGDEWDAFTPWRFVMGYLHRPGVRKAIKQRSHRKDRRQAKRNIRKEE